MDKEKIEQFLKKRREKEQTPTKKQLTVILGSKIDFFSGILINMNEIIQTPTLLEEYRKELEFKFVSYIHICIKKWIEEAKNKYDNIYIFNQSIFDFFERLNIPTIKLEGNIKEFICENCNRTFIEKKSCKCENTKYKRNVISLDNNNNNYKSLLEKLGFSKMEGLYFQDQTLKEEDRIKNDIWNVDYKKNILNEIVLIGYDNYLIDIEKYLEDLFKLRKNHNLISIIHDIENIEIELKKNNLIT